VRWYLYFAFHQYENTTMHKNFIRSMIKTDVCARSKVESDRTRETEQERQKDRRTDRHTDTQRDPSMVILATRLLELRNQ